MAAIAVPVLEGAGAALAWLARAAVATLGGAAANEALKRREESVDNAKAKPIAQADTISTTKTCSKCPPDCGTLVERNWHMSEGSRAYQARITGFAPGTEWNFGGLDFDGFRSGLCMLQEAKANYDQFFRLDGQPFGWYRGFDRMADQAMLQSQVARAAPPSVLQWSFMTPKAYAHMSRRLRAMRPLVPVYEP